MSPFRSDIAFLLDRLVLLGPDPSIAARSPMFTAFANEPSYCICDDYATPAWQKLKEDALLLSCGGAFRTNFLNREGAGW